MPVVEELSIPVIPKTCRLKLKKEMASKLIVNASRPLK